MSAPAMGLAWDPLHLEYDFGPGHPFAMAHRALAVDLLRAVPGASEWIREIGPLPVADDRLLLRFHEPEYLRTVRTAAGLLRGATCLDEGDTPAFPGCDRAAARIVAGTVEAMRAVLHDGIPAFHPAGGLHHAHAGRASGFCIFNDVVLAILTALDEVDRVAYIDLDAHHGDGVMEAFYDTARVLDVDLHQDGRTLFPGTGMVEDTGRGDGAGYTINLPLPPGAGDRALTGLVRRVVVPLLDEYRPDAIVVQHGVDGHAGDPLAGLAYTAAGYAVALREIRFAARRLCRGRLLLTGGGGYHAVHVALLLARAGALLATDALPGGPLPEPWRRHFTSTTGHDDAPRRWEPDPAPGGPERWSRDAEEALVAGLSAALGRRFPGEGYGSTAP
ncbi:MAG: acetoin utilization protein AcuC [Thermoplasmata archaeon]